jgi:hypothetical protein
LTLGAVALGAYAAGRMKKGRTALRLALWAGGARTDPRRLLREGLLQLVNSAEGKLLVAQLRGPMLDAGRRAVGATIEGQLAALADTLEKRTAALTQNTRDLTDNVDQDDEAPRSTGDGNVEDDEGRAADDGYHDEERDDEERDDETGSPDEEGSDTDEEGSDTDEEEPGRRRGEARTRRTRDTEPAAGPAASKRATPQRRPRKEGAR